MKKLYLFLTGALFLSFALSGSESLEKVSSQSATEEQRKYEIALIVAIQEKKLDHVRELVLKVKNLDFRGSEGMTPLIIALVSDYTEAAQILISKGASIHATGEHKVTPLQAAA